MYFVCLIQAARLGISNLFLPIRLRALRDEGCLCANKRAVISFSRKMKANLMDHGLLEVLSDCEVDQGAALLAFALENEISWTDSEALG